MQTSDAAICDDPLAAFYTDALTLLEASGIPFLVGGTFAFARYTNIDRPTKDLDIFVRPSDLARTLEMFDAEGYTTELTFPHWLAKIKRGSSVIDVGARIESSLLGRNARVYRAASKPRAYNLMLGDRSQVGLV